MKTKTALKLLAEIQYILNVACEGMYSPLEKELKTFKKNHKAFKNAGFILKQTSTTLTLNGVETKYFNEVIVAVQS